MTLCIELTCAYKFRQAIWVNSPYNIDKKKIGINYNSSISIFNNKLLNLFH
jgi:hypothetical protein